MASRIACIFGTRPEIIKMAPIVRELRDSRSFDVVTLSSGQHADMIRPLAEWFDVSIDRDLAVMTPSQDLNGLLAKMIGRFGEIFAEDRYDYIIGQGDTTTVLASAIAAFHTRTPFAHIEAGLRTHDLQLPFPEEMNRTVIGTLATLHFAPTELARDNLRAEGVKEDTIHLVGNTVIDALYYSRDRLPADRRAPASDEKVVFVTAHRRENIGEPLHRICAAIKAIATRRPDVRFVFPVHPNPKVRQTVYPLLEGMPNVTLTEPLPYPDLIAALEGCSIALTDSGGIQEEAPAFGKPVLVLREETERPELLELGGSMLVGSDQGLIEQSVETLLDDPSAYARMVVGHSPYGDGKSAQRIRAVMETIHQLREHA